MATILESQTEEMSFADAHLQSVIAQTQTQKDIHDAQQALEIKRQKLELLKTAKDALIANRSNAPVGERIITDEEVVAYAATLEKFLNT